MADEERGSDESKLHEVQVPLPPLPKKRRSTTFAKCIICQSDSKDKLRKGKESSVANLISKLKIRQDDVYQRLSPDLDLLYENEVLWHASCYATYTSVQNIKYASSKATKVVEADSEKMSTEPSPRVSRSSRAPHDWSKCMFCKKITHKKEKSLQNVSTFEAANNITQCAEAKGDEDMLRLLLGVSYDLVAAEAKYHKACFASYVSKSNLKSKAFREEAGKETAYDKAFLEMASDITEGLESGKAYDMCSLLKKYTALLGKRGINGQNYTKQKLKLRMTSHFGEAIVFHQPYQKTNPELVYSSSISLQDVINASAIENNKQLSLQTENGNQSIQDPSPTLSLYRAAKLLKDEMRQCKGISIYPTSVNDIELATAKKIVPKNLYLFLRWMVTNDDIEVEFESSCSNDADERKIVCMAQDAIHCSSHGRVKLPKHVGLAMSVRHITGSKQLVSILNRMGHCSSYDEIESIDTGLAKEILAKSQQTGTVLPSNICPGSFIQFAADNNDLNEETLDGKSMTHATTLVVFQKKPYGPMPPPAVHADHSKKERSLERINVYDEILECSAQGKRPAVKDFLGTLEPRTEIFSTTEEYKSSCKMDLTWALARLSPVKLFKEEDQRRSENEETIHQTIPGWSGFNSLVFPDTTLPTVIGYCPMINGSSTEFSTIYTVIKKAQNMCTSLNQKDVVITFDQAIYSKAKQIMWKYPEEFPDTLIRLGGFHIALNFLAVLGKRYQGSGIEDLLIESGTYGPGTVTSLMNGRSYNRGVRAHKLTMEALFRLMWQAFIHWLNAESQQHHKENVDEKHLVENMKSFHLALKSKNAVPQRAVSITQELTTVMELFDTFRHLERARSPMFAFWDEYMHMVAMLLQFVKAERTGNWCLHLAAISTMVPYFFTHDRQNYARWLPVYLADMGQLEQKHPEVYQRFIEGEHAISRSSQPFAKVWTDMALEQSINLDSKSKGGIVGISLKADALQRWFLTSHERAAITTAVKQMCGIGDLDRTGTHKEAAPKRVDRDENDVQKIVSCFVSGLMKDPFSEESDSLSNIATGVVLPTHIAEQLLTSAEKGQEQMKRFIQQRLNSNDVSFWNAIPSLKIKTFSSMTKKTTIKGTSEKLVAITEDRDLFGRLLIVANAREVNLREILCFELSAVPYSLVHTDGTLRKTTKSDLFQILEKDVTVEPRLSFLPTLQTVYILDGRALVQMLKFAGALNFGDMAASYFEFLTSYYQLGCNRLDVVFDQYWQLSIKAGERKKRGEAIALEVRIHGTSTPVPKQFQKYISNTANKVSLSAFLTEAWAGMAKHLLPAEKELVIGGGTMDGNVALSIKNGHCHEVPALNSDHEEANTRMLLHAQHASQGAQRIIIQSPDTDVLLLCVTHCDEIGTGELWFRTGVKDRLRYIPVHKIALSLGPLICKALPVFHSLTGCDSTSALSKIGKKKAWKIISNNKVHQESLACVGHSPEVDEETAKKAEAFICSLYTISNRIPATADEARYLLFCQKAQNNLLLPPTSDSLLQHIKRANYEAYVWRKALMPRQDLPSPAGHGWKIDDNTMCPILMTKPSAPASILELINCQCIRSSCTQNCSCSSNGLACTEACRCMADENCRNPNKSCCYDSDDDDLPDIDADD